jgi:hypothetical protein
LGELETIEELEAMECLEATGGLEAAEELEAMEGLEAMGELEDIEGLETMGELEALGKPESREPRRLFGIRRLGETIGGRYSPRRMEQSACAQSRACLSASMD